MTGGGGRPSRETMKTTTCSAACPEEVCDYRFDRADLRADQRERGISAFMRIRNGADFLELTIRSHIDHFDEIVAVYNQCTDATPEILGKLQSEYGDDRLRVIHYLDRVFPPGSSDHARTPADSPHSLVNYYNFALASTRYSHATKLDDDHLAIEDSLARVVAQVREEIDDRSMACFSGLNVFPGPQGELGISRCDPISGGGDIGFFRVSDETYFTRDRRFERFHRRGIQRYFAGYLYWHLKYLKPELGFRNYEIANYLTSRYASRQERLQREPQPIIGLDDLASIRHRRPLSWISSLVSEKQGIIRDRDAAIAGTFPDHDVWTAIERTVSPTMFALFRASLL